MSPSRTPEIQKSLGGPSRKAARALKFDFPMPLNVANSRLHWRVKDNARKAYFETCDAMQAAKLLPPPPATPFGRSRIASLMMLGGKMDADNAMARHKWPLDWLQSRRYLTNDRDLEWTALPTQLVSRSSNYVLAITLTEIKND